MTRVRFECLAFEDLSLKQLYQIMAIRQKVFVVEQNCPYVDADGQDIYGWHLIGYNEMDEIVAYIRILPKGISYPEYASFGRVLTTNTARGKGIGKILLKKCMDYLPKLVGDDKIKIGAQVYLVNFYKGFGFEVSSPEYIEDGIPHVSMILKPSGSNLL